MGSSIRGRLARRIEDLWWRETPPGWLRPLEAIYARINRANLDRRAQRTVAVDRPVISVGNLTAGGSGKTPFVAWLARELKRAGFSPVILCRGDGGRLEHPERVTAETPPDRAGDEAVMLAVETGLPVVAGRDRIEGARLASRLGDVIVLDDGFQYRQLDRCLDIVLVPNEGVGNGHLIPAGPLREPLKSLTRADFVVRTGTGDARPEPLGGGIRREWTWNAIPEGIAGWDRTPDACIAVCGIARPERFKRTLETLGIHPQAMHCFPDHHRYTARDVTRLTGPGLAVVTTFKDAVKLQRLWPDAPPLGWVRLKPEPEPGLIEAILAQLDKQGPATSLA